MLLIKDDEKLPAGQFYTEKWKKTRIVLHHTVSHGKYGVDGAVNTWKATNYKEGTAYIIAEDGTVYELFPPECWALHLYLHKPGENPEMYQDEKSSIGIELVNAGQLVKKVPSRSPSDLSNGSETNSIEATEADEFFWFGGKHKYDGKVYQHKEEWRGSKYYAEYTDEQYAALNELLDRLCKQFNIPRYQIITSFAWEPNRGGVQGIFSHHNFRKDKSDVSVAFDFKRIIPKTVV